ncbi:MAG TPA: hypothetical protein VE173_02125 [Longimicrobiales bacterium]|nr:hypothetical protein [Longimicrobiales bacterium]
MDELPPSLRAPALSTSTWTRVQRSGFSFLLPPGFENLGLQPIDSDAAVYVKDEASSLSYDYGAYSGPIHVPAGASDVIRNVRTRIGGREVTLLAFREGGAWVVGARWADLGHDAQGDLALVMTGRTPSEDVRDEILAAIHSVTFP